MTRLAGRPATGEDRADPARLISAMTPDATRPLRIALLGTRGVPAAYGGFETAVEEVGQRLVSWGHDVTVYCRTAKDEAHPAAHLGMQLVHLPAVKRKALETLSHTALSAAHVVLRQQHDAAILFNAANAPFLPVLRAGGLPVATHVDGLEWRRAKWGGAGKRYYRTAECLAVRWSNALIADAPGIANYYRAEFDADTELIAYGATVLRGLSDHRLAEQDLRSGGFHLVVARFEPENNVELSLQGYLRSSAREPLVVVGSAPYAHEYTRRIRELAATDSRVRLLGGVFDQELLDQLYAHALTYVHGHSVGGTNPSLLRAMGAGTAVLAYDVDFNRDVLGEQGRLFSDADDLAAALQAAEGDRTATRVQGEGHRARVESCYRWDDVARRYESLCRRLAAGSLQQSATGRRRAPRSASVSLLALPEPRPASDPLVVPDLAAQAPTHAPSFERTVKGTELRATPAVGSARERLAADVPVAATEPTEAERSDTAEQLEQIELIPAV